ncbi:PQQ-dependent sugar dehydrogenase [soil metagenome]
MIKYLFSIVATALLLGACHAAGDATQSTRVDDAGLPFTVQEVARFNEPWAMTFLPDGRLLVTEKRGRLKLLEIGGDANNVSGVPEVDYGGQGGLSDVVLHPDFANNQTLYLSYAEAGNAGKRGAAVARAKLTLDEAGGGELSDVEVVWRQVPKVTGEGHYGHRLAFGPDGYLWISSGERQKFDPAQDMQANLGKILRLNDDGSVPADNPFAEQGGVTAEIWSLGHRNPLGIAFDGKGQLWNIEMGPRGGDELNRVERGANYGYPIVSEGNHYDGRRIPDHDTQPRFNAPAIAWTPVISPASFIIYDGEAFPDWQGDGLIAGLSAQGLVRVELDGKTAHEVARYEFGERLREVEQGPDGYVWILEDDRDDSDGQLLKLSPRS